MLSAIATQCLVSLANSAGPNYLNAQEGQELAAANLINVNSGVVSPNDSSKFLVEVNEHGLAYLEQLSVSQAVQAPSFPSVPSVPAVNYPSAPSLPLPVAQTTTSVSTSFAIDDEVALPTIKRGNPGNLTPRQSQYPFDSLQIGQSFHVPATADDPDPAKRMHSNVSAANTRYPQPTGNKIQVTHKKLVKENGVAKIGPDGKRVYESVVVTEDETVPTRHFVCRPVDATDKRGAACRVFRVEIPAKKS